MQNENSNEAILIPWALDAGCTVISDNKGLENSWMSMLSGTRSSQY